MTAHAPRSFVEPLEARRLMSAVSPISLHDGTLFINGQSRVANNVIVYHDTATGMLEVSLAVTPKKATAEQVFTGSFPLADVSRVFVKGGNFNDTISVGRLDANFLVDVVVMAGKGNDDISTGGGADFIHGGDGDDTIDAGDGDNVILAHKGKDIVTTGAGNDRIHAGHDDDLVNSGAGDDLVRCGKGDDTVNAGDGNDIVHGQHDNDTIHGDAGNDVLWGGKGDDALFGDDGDDKVGGLIGVDSLTGGAGMDEFVVRDPLAPAGTDVDLAAGDIVTVNKSKKDGDESEAV